jgi:hypothetical protein
MYNLNPRYAMINDNIDYMKNEIMNMSYETLLDLCPRIKIPINTLFYHSTKLTSFDILSKKNILYPVFDGCQTCKYNLPIPQENIGDKPRIMELSANPNRKFNNKCVCSTGQQERMYGNFNFAGNYSLDLGKTILKGTEILINDKEITLIDLNYISAELGFSPKHFFLNNNEVSNQFGKQRNWQTYCKNNNIDGIIMVDIVDVQDICLSEKTILSCYNHVNPFNEKQGTACPEFVLISTVGPNVDSINPIGTEKLKILGMVNLYDQVENKKLTRYQVEMLFGFFFYNLYNVFNMVLPGVKFDLTYNGSFTIFKQLSVIYNNNLLNASQLFQYIKMYIQNYGSEDFYIDINKTYPYKKPDNIYQSDLCYLENYTKKQLELFEPIALSKHVELYTDIIVNNILPKDNNYFYYKTGELVIRYASDMIFNYVLNKTFNNTFSKLLYVNYHLLSSVKYYDKYTLEYFKSLYTTKNPVKNIKKFIDDLELEIVTNFYIRCYIVNNKLTLNNIEYYNKLYEQIYNYIKNSKFNFDIIRTKSWDEFKNSYLSESPESYKCDNDQLLRQVITKDNFMVKYLYQLLNFNGYYIDAPLNNILENINDENINVELLYAYTKLLDNDLNEIYNVYNNKINELLYMMI